METQEELLSVAAAFGLEAPVRAQRWLAALEGLMPALYSADGTPVDGSAPAARLRDGLLAHMKQNMLTATEPPKNRMKFGTSGWRGLLVDDFTVHTVACVTQGLVDVLLNPAHHAALGVIDNDDLRARGGVIAHDTRIMGPEFAATASRVMLAHGIKVIWIGMATTPEVSAAIAETNAAFSINFTPSHNPFTYHGYKFNPADGGPAPASLTVPVAARANQIFDESLSYQMLDESAWAAAQQNPALVVRLDPVDLYKACLKRRLPWLDLTALVHEINTQGMDVFVDCGFGATSGKYQRLFEGIRPEHLHIFNDGQDYLFGGKNREPSVANFRSLQQAMQRSSAPLVVGFMNDGDGDRFVGGGRTSVLVMNKYGPMVVRYLTRSKGLRGDITRSVMTSHMADSARQVYLPDHQLYETAVGFQYLRNTIPQSVNSWEESDGMSPMGWSLDKDGLVAALLLASMVLDARTPVEQLLSQCEQELGHFYFERRKVSGKLSGAALTNALAQRFGQYAPGDAIEIAGRTFHVSRLITLDGFKLVLDNGWWFAVRASGTEPVVRPYVETFAPLNASPAAQQEAEAWQQKICGWLEAEVHKSIA